ncbi:b70aff9a-902b-487a-8f75-5a5b7bcaae2e [Thermothielavioides terrestris]|uniref:B70aff9a-902b-487a-8f75-5a5b7bcaae2e n=1 Tax=Thermothielavioides terrestris TaxID=2587410 RepID=A0A3S4ATD0_9PEZI|nr:b70aff9a-902b-487a-8f75-5a5b7bcaae2e [Thermothielavioides terrestris]
MWPRELRVVERGGVQRRQNKTPCPGGNGTTIGTDQSFTVLCNTDLGGDVLSRPSAGDLTASNCPTLNGAQQALGTSFTTLCGFIIDGNDISQNYAPTFQDCMGQCASTTGCAALSFDPSQNLGFKNCYLKTTVTNSSAPVLFKQLGSNTGSSCIVGSGGVYPPTVLFVNQRLRWGRVFHSAQR